MDINLSSNTYDILSDVVEDTIENYSVSVQDSNKKGEGYLGEICYISLKNKRSGEIIDLVIKQAFSDKTVRDMFPIRRYYLNEVHFYSKVWPCFRNFQSEKCIPRPFDKIPKCFATSLEFKREKLALENLKFQDFHIHDKKKPFDDEHLTFILKEYGKLHAISFAYKSLHPEEYRDLAKGFEDLFGGIVKVKSFSDFFVYVCELSLKSLDEVEDIKAIEKFKVFSKNCVKIFQDKSNYSGDYSVILHGDCWSNNMMLKYEKQNNRLCDIRLLDFQLSKEGTPVSDLSYFLYSGGSKDTLDRLDHYLKVYHDSLMSAVNAFGLDSENIYPFEELKKDWKKYCHTGFQMGLVLWKSKLVTSAVVTDLTDAKENEGDGGVDKPEYDQEAFKMRSRDLILHMVKNDFL